VAAVACPSSSTCYAAGDGILSTTDSGRTWQVQPTPADARKLDAIACPSTSICYATGYGAILTTTDSGATWIDEAVPTGTDPLTGIACTTTTTCVAVGSVLNCLVGENAPCPPGRFAVVSTTDSGRVWTGHALATDVNPISVACATGSTCVATAYVGSAANYDFNYGGGEAGSVLATTDLGITWSTQTVPPDTGILTVVICPSPTTCYAAGQGTGDIGGLILKASLLP